MAVEHRAAPTARKILEPLIANDAKVEEYEITRRTLWLKNLSEPNC